MRCVRQRIMDEHWRYAFLQCVPLECFGLPNKHVSWCVVRFGLICLCIVRFGVCDKWKDNGWKWEGHLSIAAAQPRYKRSPWDWFTFLRHLFYSKMTTIVDPGYAVKLLLYRRGAELSWLWMHDKEGAIVASSCCMTTTAGSDCAALPWHM